MPVADARVVPDAVNLVCSAAGLRDRDAGATEFRTVSEAPCLRAAMLSTGLYVTRGDPRTRNVLRADGSMVGTYGEEWRAPLDAEVISRCIEGTEDADSLDVATLEVRHITGGCVGARTRSADASLLARTHGSSVTLTRTVDGARLTLRRFSGGAGVVAQADDGAVWIETGDDGLSGIAFVREGETIADEVLLGDSDVARRRSYRPTLLADFFEGRPLPAASR